MTSSLIQDLQSALTQIKSDGLYKSEAPLSTPQSAHVNIHGHTADQAVLNLCSNNYLGFADHPQIKSAAKEAIDAYGFGMASVRFICGTQTLHQQLERELADFLGKEDAILFASCFDANAGVFETLLGSDDAILSDALNHASIIDGIRLCKASRFRYANNDMEALEAQLKVAQDSRYRMIVTDGVFSMDGVLADLPKIAALAEQYDAAVMVDDSHAVGFVGPDGAGTPSHFGINDQITLLTGTFGKALGGAAGGYIAGPQVIIDMLRQRARPYLFSNALPPPIVAATLTALELVREGGVERQALSTNAAYFRDRLHKAGFSLAGDEHAIIPVMIGEAKLAQQFAKALLDKGIYVTAFSYPVVPKGAARIRTQISASHSEQDLSMAADAFIAVGQSLGVI